MRKSIQLAAVLLAVAALAGCNTMPILNVSDSPAVSASTDAA